MSIISRIRKRDGHISNFDQEKITQAIWKAAQSVGGTDHSLAEKIGNQVCTVLEVFFKSDENVPSVEQIQDLVEKILIENGHAKTAKAYILYRQEHQKLREEKAEILGLPSESQFSVNAIKVLRQFFLQRDEKGDICETPEQMLRRVAHAVAQADNNYEGSNAEESENQFYELMLHKHFLPESTILMNAGTPVAPLSGEIHLSLKDSLEDIFDVLKHSLLMYQSGSKVIVDFSKIRPRSDIITSSHGIASGPVAFLKTFDTAFENIKHGHKKHRKNLAVLNIHHPDILEFLTSKDSENDLTNFNIAIVVTAKFMEAQALDLEYELTNPRTGKTVNHLNARNVFDLIISSNWKNGQPEIIFQKDIKPLADDAFAAASQGFLNLANCVSGKEINWKQLQQNIQAATHFLDNTIDIGKYPIPSIEKVAKEKRDIALGIMGFAEFLEKLGIPYLSLEALKKAEEIMSFIQKETRAASSMIATKRGLSNSSDSMRNGSHVSLYQAKSISRIMEVTDSIKPKDQKTPLEIKPEEQMLIHQTFEKYCDQPLKSAIIFNQNTGLQTLKKFTISAYEKNFKNISITRKKTKSGLREKVASPKEAKKTVAQKDWSQQWNLQPVAEKPTKEKKEIFTSGLRSQEIFLPELNIKKAKQKQTPLPFTDGTDSIDEKIKTEALPLNQKKIQEVLPPPIESNEISEANINKYHFSTNFKSLKAKHCPKCQALTQTGEDCLLCLQCGFSASVVQEP